MPGYFHDRDRSRWEEIQADQDKKLRRVRAEGQLSKGPRDLHKRCRDALAECEKRFFAVTSRNSEGIIVVNRDGIILFANPTAERLFGRSAEQLRGSAFGFPLSDDFVEISLLQPGGHSIVVEMRVENAEWGGRRAFLVSLLDVTERKQNERSIQEKHEMLVAFNEELLRTARSKSYFLGTVSHELRTPLNAIIGFSELLAHDRTAMPETELQRFIDYIHEAGLHLLTMVRDLLDLARLEAGRLALNCVWFELGEAVHSALETLMPMLREKKLKLKQPGRRLGEVYADPVRFRQILYNLLSNAIKFTPSRGRIELSVERRDEFIEIHIRDTGSGIPEADQQKIFQPFEQLADHGLEGAGLGLAITQQLVKAHHGRIEVKASEAGSCFSVYLPQCPPDANGPVDGLPTAS
jgi:signal transduction histidine kinase